MIHELLLSTYLMCCATFQHKASLSDISILPVFLHSPIFNKRVSSQCSAWAGAVRLPFPWRYWSGLQNQLSSSKYPENLAALNFPENSKSTTSSHHTAHVPQSRKVFCASQTGTSYFIYLSGGTLDQRLRAHQVRDGHPFHGRISRVTKKEPADLIKRWIAELSHAVAWLESLGYVHADIRPPNLLLDGNEHLKLVDFDCVAKIGTPSAGSAPPWARVLGAEARGEAGSFGVYGARTEQFAVGSALFYMTRGYEPYENEDPDLDVVKLFQRMEFPPLGDDDFDRAIDRCWKGGFEYLKDLADETKRLGGRDAEPVMCFTEEYCLERREECQGLVEQGLLEWD